MRERAIVLITLMLASGVALAQAPAPLPSPAAQAPPQQTATTGEPEAMPSADPARTNTLHWVVKGGSTNYAYEVFRAESEAGPFVKVNRSFISGHINKRSQTVAGYSYVDADIDLTKDYWYYVESINLMGVRDRLTPVKKAPAKQPAAAPAAR